MINGVSLSEIESVNRTRLSHCRRVTQIEEGSFTRFSVQESELAKVYHKKKLNHVPPDPLRNDGDDTTRRVPIRLIRIHL